MSYSSEVLTDSPLLYWRLGETSGTTAADASGNSRSGTILGGPTLGAAGLQSSDSNTAVEFAVDSGQCVQVSSAAWMNVSTLTVECLVKFTAASNAADANGDAIVGRATSSGWDWLLWRKPSGALEVQLSGASGATWTLTSTFIPTVSTAYHVAFTYDGTTMRLYVNGAEVANLGSLTGGIWSGASPIEIGRYSVAAVTTPPAVIDEVAIYGSALSATRIAAHNSAASAPAAVTGTLSGTLPALTGSLSGGIEFSGTVAAVLPALGANLAGTSLPPGVAGTLSATLPQLGGSLVGAYSDTATLAAILPPLSADLAGAYAPPPASGSLSATLPGLAANLAGQAFEPGVGGFLAGALPALSASLSGDVLGRAGYGLVLDSDAVLTVYADLAPEPTVPAGTPATVLHVIAPTVPVPTLVAGRPQ